MSAKRADLQGIRGLAIISVILFHFFPDLFPNGYIGVDQFFVLSGFLIAMILDREKELNLSSMTSFYYRRLKRIVPLYLIVVLLIILSLFMIFPSSNRDLNIESAWPSLFFMKNIIQGNSLEMNYAKMLSQAEDLFTHTWSLGVEMQFYLIAPILIISTKYISRIFMISFFGATALISLAYFILSDESTSFHSVFARIWQFIIGMLSHLIVQTTPTVTDDTELLLESGPIGRNKEESNILNNQRATRISIFIVHLSTLVLVILMFFPSTIHTLKLRLFVSSLTGVLIIYGGALSSSFLTRRPLVYAGDISYALYLVHWPIYAYVKLNYFNNMLTALLLGILISITVAILLTETVEKYYLTLGKKSIVGLIIGLYGLNSLLLLHQERIDQILSPSRTITFLNSKDGTASDDMMYKRVNFTTAQIVSINEQYRLHDTENLISPTCNYTAKGPYEWCNFTISNNSTQGLSMMIIGNSYAPNNVKPVHKYCSQKAKSMKMFSRAGCEILTLTQLKGYKCVDTYDDYLKAVQLEKPEVLFMFVRYINTMFNSLNSSVLMDPIYILARERLRLYEEAVQRKIFIIQALPVPSEQLTQLLNSALKRGERIGNILLENRVDVSSARQRIDALVKDCPKCKSIDYMDIFNQNGQFTYYNNATGESYFNSGQHLTSLGLHQVEPLYSKLCNKL